MARRLTDEHVFPCKANEGNVYSAHLFIYVPFPEPSMCHGSQCELVALKIREPSNCKLQQSLCQWKQWITDFNLGWVVAAPYMCHQRVIWHGCCHGEAPCSGNVWSLIEGTQPSPQVTHAPMNVFWKLSTADNTVTGFLSGSLVGRRVEENHLEKAEK